MIVSMVAINRQYGRFDTSPAAEIGQCPACQSNVWLPALVIGQNPLVSCTHCGRASERESIIRTALSNLSPIAWSLLSSDFAIYDTVELRLGDYATYAVNEQVTRWLHMELAPNEPSGARYVATASSYPPNLFVALRDTRPAEAPQALTDPVTVQWYWFGLASTMVVPAWRHCLFGAYRLLTTEPAAAVVLIAAGFESYFIDAMRVRWTEQQRDPKAFKRLTDRVQQISSLVEWLPAAVSLPSIRDDNTLWTRWQTAVNKRKNDVVHRGNLAITVEEGLDSLATALECITFIDTFALSRPHRYYARV